MNDNRSVKISRLSRVAAILPPAFIMMVLTILILTLTSAGCGDDEKPTPPTPEPELSIEAVNGLLYKSLMVSSTTDPALSFRVVDTADDPVQDATVQFAVVTGDGTLSDGSLVSNASGLVNPVYTFDGALGHAVIRAWIAGMDTIEVQLRANTPIPGPDGQAQYVMFDETYGDVKDWNGLPSGLFERTCSPDNLIDAVYEATEGVVFVMADINANSLADDSDPVVGCFFTSQYAPTTVDGLGIGSDFANVAGVYGAPIDTLLNASAPPVAWVYKYDTPYMNWWVDTLSDTVFQIDFFEATPCTGSAKTASEAPYRYILVDIEP